MSVRVRGSTGFWFLVVSGFCARDVMIRRIVKLSGVQDQLVVEGLRFTWEVKGVGSSFFFFFLGGGGGRG